MSTDYSAVNTGLKANSNQLFNTSQHGGIGSHSYSGDEVRAFASYINKVLAADQRLADRLPLDPLNHETFFNALRDGTVLCKLLNEVKPGVIDPRHISYNTSVHHITQNLNTALRACKDLGIQTVNISAEDFISGTRHLMLSILWQAIRLNLVKQINLELHPEICTLMEPNEDQQSFLHMTPENTLLRWFNQQLTTYGHPRKVTNFTSDISDGENYLVLMHQIAPSIVSQEVLSVTDPTKRAQLVCDLATKMGLEPFVAPNDILNGNRNLNMAFVADLFNKYPALAVKQNYDNLQNQVLLQAQQDLKVREEEEERLRKLRWAEEEAGRAASWAAEDQARRSQHEAEDQARRQREELQNRQLDDEARRIQAEREALENERKRLESLSVEGEESLKAKLRELQQIEEETKKRHEAAQRRAEEERRRMEEELRRQEEERRRHEESSRRGLEEERRKLEEERRDWETRTSVQQQQPQSPQATQGGYQDNSIYATVQLTATGVAPVPAGADYYPAAPVPFSSTPHDPSLYNTYNTTYNTATPPFGATAYAPDPYAGTMGVGGYGMPYGTNMNTNVYHPGGMPGGNASNATTINISGKIKKKAMKNLTKNLPQITAQAQGPQPGYAPMSPHGQPGYAPQGPYGAQPYYPPPPQY